MVARDIPDSMFLSSLMKKVVRKTRRRGGWPKNRKSQTWPKCWEASFLPAHIRKEVCFIFHFCGPSQMSLFVLDKDVNDLECEHLAKLFTSKNRCRKFFEGHLWEKSQNEEGEDIATNLSILIFVHLDKGAWGDEFFWSLGIESWPLSVRHFFGKILIWHRFRGGFGWNNTVSNVLCFIVF